MIRGGVISSGTAVTVSAFATNRARSPTVTLTCDRRSPTSPTTCKSAVSAQKPFNSNANCFRVVTGIRFYKQNRIIHLQIQEGQLLERGKINATSTRWVPVEDYTIYDKGIRDGRDYHTLAWDRREVDLDDLTAPVGHVVVSLKSHSISGENQFAVQIFADWCEISRCRASFES